jgi:hypothetical protein
MSALQLDTVVGRARVGCKGPAAESWLATHGIRVPRAANSYEVDESGVLTARLATSEFLVESTETASETTVGSVRSALHGGDYPKGVYPVLRSDFVLEISGAQSEELFLQTCAVDIAPVARVSAATAGPIVMTSMIGVAVVLACRRTSASPQSPGGSEPRTLSLSRPAIEGSGSTRFTVWSDPSYSTYFHSQLQAIAADVIGRY